MISIETWNFKSPKTLRIALSTLAIILAAMDTWTSRYRVNPMGISYLDMGDAFMRGDWQTALNGLWSPLYSIPLGVVMRLTRPALMSEFPLVHLVNFFFFVAALLAFDFFLRQLIAWNHARAKTLKDGTTTVPDWAIVILAYALFLWCSLGLILIATTAPDMLLAMFIYLTFGMLLRINAGADSWRSFFLLGLIIGFGYLSKAPMLLLGVLFILVGLFLAKNRRQSGERLAAAALGLFLIAGPFIIALSASRHRLTYGDSGNLNYAWHINNVPFFHWQGDPVHGTPIHPTRKIFNQPAVYEFGTPLNATYPPWYDPSYWYDGVKPQLNLSQHKATLIVSLKRYLDLFTYGSHLTLLAGFLVLSYMSRRNWLRNLLAEWKLLILPLAALALFLPIHVEPRYVAAFLPALWLFLFMSLRSPADEKTKKRVGYVVIAIASLIIVAQSGRSITSVMYALRDPTIRPADRAQLKVAAELIQRGFQPGDAVGLVNFNQNWLPIVHWARLARLRIVAELPNTDSAAFGAADDATQREIGSIFAKAGAKALVANQVPEDVKLSGWERLGDTSYYVLKLDQPERK